MTTPLQASASSSRKPPRLWPGVAAIILLLVARFGVKAVIPGFAGFALGMQWTLGIVVIVLLWWLFFSRVRWLDRLGVFALMVVGLAAAWMLRHESMGPLWLFVYAIPYLCVALVASAVAARRLSDRARRATMAAAILMTCGVWTLFRTSGISGDHVAAFGWRWTQSAEERLVTQGNPPAPVSPAPAAVKTQAEAPAASEPAVERVAPRESRGDPEQSRRVEGPAMSESGISRAEWPGFRGRERDGISHGVHIDTNWTASPPVELWRRPVGPGWSSFAVTGDRLYTQEQRGGDEVVSSYNLTTGAPVWTHRDPARFFESNAGAGPRGTPALRDGRVYTFGATGIVNALDARDGAVVWSRNAAADADVEVPTWGFSSSPLVVGDIVIVAVSGRLAAYDLASGKPRWLGPDGGASYSSPQLVTIDGVAQVLLVGGTGTTSVAPADGTPLWQHLWPGFPIVQPALTADGGLLVVASNGSGTRRLAVARRSGEWSVEPRWTSNGLKPYFNDFVVHKGHVFGFDGRILACIDLETGARVWKGGRYGSGQLVLLPEQDLMLVVSEDGELALVQATPDRFTEVARFPAIQGKTWNHPVLAGDVLLVRNGEEMAAFRLSRMKP